MFYLVKRCDYVYFTLLDYELCVFLIVLLKIMHLFTEKMLINRPTEEIKTSIK